MSRTIVGLTSSIGGGKTTAIELFSQCGIDHVDADTISHQLTVKGTDLAEEIIAHFGEDYRNQDGSLNRQALRDRIFTIASDRIWLEKLLHPHIRTELVKQLKQCHSPYALLVAPLLFETSLYKICDQTIVIGVTQQLQLERVRSRDNISKRQAQEILAAQMPLSEKIKRADHLIENNGTKEEFAKKIQQLHYELLAKLKNNYAS